MKFGLNLEQKRAGDPANLPATAKRTQHLIKMPQSDLHILIKFALLPEKEKRNKGWARGEEGSVGGGELLLSLLFLKICKKARNTCDHKCIKFCAHSEQKSAGKKQSVEGKLGWKTHWMLAKWVGEGGRCVGGGRACAFWDLRRAKGRTQRRQQREQNSRKVSVTEKVDTTHSSSLPPSHSPANTLSETSDNKGHNATACRVN